jgi:hypothetical protein
MKAFKRISFVPGATRAYDEFGVPIKPRQVVLDEFGKPASPRRVLPMWNMPKPLHHVHHFKSAGMRAKFERGEIKKPEATNLVPVYRGLDIRLFRTLRNDQRQEIKRRERRRTRWARFAQKIAAFPFRYNNTNIKDTI